MVKHKNISLTYVTLVGLLCSLFGMSGCLKTYEFVPTEFPQPRVKSECHSLTKHCLRSAFVYEQFETKALFDVLHFSSHASDLYTDMYCNRRGKDAAAKEVLQHKQDEELSKSVVFYLLADVRDAVTTSLVEKNSQWSIYLSAPECDKDGIATGLSLKLTPTELKEADLEPEIRSMFGACYSAFKTLYKVSFSALNDKGERCINEDGPLTMHLSSVTSECELTWNVEVLAGKDHKKGHDKAAAKNKTVIKRLKVDEHETDIYWL